LILLRYTGGDFLHGGAFLSRTTADGFFIEGAILS